MSVSGYTAAAGRLVNSVGKHLLSKWKNMLLEKTKVKKLTEEERYIFKLGLLRMVQSNETGNKQTIISIHQMELGFNEYSVLMLY